MTYVKTVLERMPCEGIAMSFAWGISSELETRLEVKPSIGEGMPSGTPAYGGCPPFRVGRRLMGW